MISSELKDTFLTLVRQGIGTADGSLESVNWAEVKALSKKYGLSAVVLDGANSMALKGGLPAVAEMDYPFKKQWIGTAVKSYEYRYESYKKAIRSLAAFYNSHGFKMMVLKGYACSLDWPNPCHRPSGDIDIWLFGRYKEADEALSSEKGVKINSSHHHHTVFRVGKFLVENHYDFINVHHHKSNQQLEKILKEFGQDDSYYTEIDGERVYLPSPNLHALFLLEHAMLHFVTSDINLRQVIDWAFFVKAHGKEVDWQRIMNVLEEFGMKPFFGIFNSICVEHLGFNASDFPYVSEDNALKTRTLNEILSPEFQTEYPAHLIPRVIYKFRLWKSSTWKYKLCYRESMWSNFWTGVWSHILKPSSI